MPQFVGEDILNMDETGCFWRALPDKGMAKIKKECKGGKKSKHRVTIATYPGSNHAGEEKRT